MSKNNITNTNSKQNCDLNSMSSWTYVFFTSYLLKSGWTDTLVTPALDLASLGAIMPVNTLKYFVSISEHDSEVSPAV